MNNTSDDTPEVRLPDVLTRLLHPVRYTERELAAAFADALVGLSLFKQLNTSDQDITAFCRKKGLTVLGYDYDAPPPLGELLPGAPPERPPVGDGPNDVWNTWLALGDELAAATHQRDLADTMDTLRKWPTVRSQPVAPANTVVIPFRRPANPAS
jgi:hypothetical protein